MTGERRRYVVDRVEGDRAVLIGDDDRRSTDVPLTTLPLRVREAMVLTVPLDPGGKPVWSLAVRDEAEEARRQAEGRARLERLRGRDPGTDITS